MTQTLASIYVANIKHDFLTSFGGQEQLVDDGITTTLKFKEFKEYQNQEHPSTETHSLSFYNII